MGTACSAARARAGRAQPPQRERRAGRRRRGAAPTFALLTLVSAACATALFANAQPDYGNAWLEWGQIALFAALSTWVVTGFVTALMGF